MTAPACPSCAGPHLERWRWQHSNACPIRDVEDAHQDADRTTLAARRAGFTRPATAVEVELYTLSHGTPAGELTTTVHATPGYWHRTIGDRASADPAA